MKCTVVEAKLVHYSNTGVEKALQAEEGVRGRALEAGSGQALGCGIAERREG